MNFHPLTSHPLAFVNHLKSLSFPVPAPRLALLVCAFLTSVAPLRAEKVDAELLLLVDASKSALDRGEFRSLMNGYATAMTSFQVLDSIQIGAIGRIAVSLSFFGDAPGRTQGISWMSIGSLAEAESFATQLRSLAEPSRSNIRLQDAIGPASLLFGHETGGRANGFESAVQIVEIAASSRPEGSPEANRAATDATIAAGVDWIGATLLGGNSSKAQEFYSRHVIGGDVGGLTPEVRQSSFGVGLHGTLADSISRGMVGTAAASAVPEPSAALLFVSSMAVLLGLRRRS